MAGAEPQQPRRLLRITAWNCRQGFAGKAAMLAGLGADIAVVPESGPGVLEHPGAHWLRLTADDNRGMGVVADAPWSLTPVRFEPDGPLVVPVLVDGPVAFTLLATWTTPVGDGELRYARALLDALAGSRSQFSDRPLVVAGDLNLSRALEGTSPGAFTAVADAMDELDLVSAWHTLRGEEFGQESVPTHWHGPRKSTFHIDYIWVPRAWLPAMRSVEIGAQRDWIGPGRSDHCPVTVEFSLPKLVELAGA